ncbi:MAG: hypothetical protein H6832_13535 [Planctomycetes bacterium]|nr:hypothetical protein [Planctomycetota bacterium]MCB9919419.1 hypothetical protein [Planctomycetota bacterium]
MSSEQWIALGLLPRGRFTFARLLAALLHEAALRELARAHGVKPKGFRVEKANADQLAEAVAEEFARSEPLRTAVARELESTTTVSSPRTSGEELTKSRDELVRQRDEVESKRRADEVRKLERSTSRAMRSRDDAVRQLEEARRTILELEARIAAKERDLDRLMASIASTNVGEDEHAAAAEMARVLELEKALAEAEATDHANRHRIAELMSRIRELESENRELEDFLPRGERERRKQVRKSYEDALRRTTLLPRFEAEFFRSVEALQVAERRQVFTALARLILFGSDYPSLQFKSLKGTGGISSIRASEGLRIYFVRTEDTVLILDCGQREQQDGWLKRRRG